jgi:hypothetical protein
MTTPKLEPPLFRLKHLNATSAALSLSGKHWAPKLVRAKPLATKRNR